MTIIKIKHDQLQKRKKEKKKNHKLLLHICLDYALEVQVQCGFAAHLSTFPSVSCSQRGEDLPVDSDCRGEEAEAILYSANSSHTQGEEMKEC